MIYDKDKSIEKIKELGLPEIFVDIWNGEPPESIEYECQEPKTFSYLQENYRVNSQGIFTNFLGLWETNGDSITGLNLETNEFIKYYFEDQIDKYKVISKSYQIFIALFLLELLESEEEVLEVKQLADRFDFEYIDFLIKEFNDDTNYELDDDIFENKIKTYITNN